MIRIWELGSPSEILPKSQKLLGFLWKYGNLEKLLKRIIVNTKVSSRKMKVITDGI